jgi:hypothetical protein
MNENKDIRAKVYFCVKWGLMLLPILVVIAGISAYGIFMCYILFGDKFREIVTEWLFRGLLFVVLPILLTLVNRCRAYGRNEKGMDL